MLHCAPSPTDTPDWLKMLVERAGITPKRLVEMAVYSPRWLEMVEEAIGWKGLTCAANLFYAYTRECYDDVDEARITPYTLLSPLEISVGVVDTAWFWKAYNALGRERYEKFSRLPRLLRNLPVYIAVSGSIRMLLWESIR